jgi:hypothetical protein
MIEKILSTGCAVEWLTPLKDSWQIDSLKLTNWSFFHLEFGNFRHYSEKLSDTAWNNVDSILILFF